MVTVPFINPKNCILIPKNSVHVFKNTVHIPIPKNPVIAP